MYALINKYSSVEAVNQFFFIKTVWNKTFRTIESSKTEIAQKGNNDKKKDQHQDEQVKKNKKYIILTIIILLFIMTMLNLSPHVMIIVVMSLSNLFGPKGTE